MSFFMPMPFVGPRILDVTGNNVNLRTLYDAKSQPVGTGQTVRFLVAAGVTVGSTSTGSAALRTGTWPAGVTLKLEVLGRIQGKGGNGGRGGSSVPTPPLAGGAGGVAFLAEHAIEIKGGGDIFGGGGGGGGGGVGETGGFAFIYGGGGASELDSLDTLSLWMVTQF